MINIPVSLVCIDCKNYKSAMLAIVESCRQIQFEEVLFFTDNDFSKDAFFDIPNFRIVKIDKITSKYEYSQFVMKRLVNYVKSDYTLIIQHDGYIINPFLWKFEFLDYEYIGAPWWYELSNVGNGGFSLRSLRLMQLLQLPEFSDVHPEDDRICRTYRSVLESKYGVRFAPEHLAKQFSFEPNPKYMDFKFDTFGFHGIPKLILK